ncbi:MAG: signal recognition particle-docking protein FtsY [Ruminococcus sp.]|jgi:fused signal recognition particle receptor|nr:signal recognition particle-docking protein FtsY [Ruminococcus sp.]
MEKLNFFQKIGFGLKKTRDNINKKLNLLFGKKIDEAFFDELEELLITSDIGMKMSEEISSKLRKIAGENAITDPARIREELINIISEQITPETSEKTARIVLVIGVNGAGKTTTIGKLAARFKAEGKRIILAAADTFRAAAVEQLEIWAKRADVEIVTRPEGSDPASVVYDAIDIFKARHADVLIIDTAGRLHNKKNLMDELAKIRRIIADKTGNSDTETLLVLDATTGQNAVSQARLFNEACDVDGIILTKLDGTAKGGIIIPISAELKIPVKYIGVGEQIDDLTPFDARAFTEALFDTDSDEQ